MALAAISATVAFFVLVPITAQFRILWDTDSYLHAAIGLHYRVHGIFEPPPWGRFSMTSWGGDKDFLYHVALIPFTAGDLATGARVALAAVSALLIGVLTLVFARRETVWALVLPWWLYATSVPFFLRIIRLRPDVASLILLLLLCEAVVRRRFALGAAAAMAYALAYTPFQVPVGLAVIWLLADRLESGRWEWRLPAWIVAGVVAGLLVRPHPLENLRLWFAQNVTFYGLVGKLDLGEEVGAPRIARLFPLIAGWLIGMAALAVTARRKPTAPDEPRPVPRWEWIAYACLLGVFVLLYARMSKMALYPYPIALATLLRWNACRSRRISAWAAPALAVGVAVAFPALADPTLLSMLGLKGEIFNEADLARFGRAVPPGARVAATWGDAEEFVFFAPQGRYLNVYDSTFMYVPYPALWEAQASLFAGRDPDIVSTIRGPLQSDYLAFNAVRMTQGFLDRTRQDPRLRLVYGGYTALLAYDASGESAFVTDWGGERRGAFVDAGAATECVTLRHEADLPRSQRFEFAPWGTGSLDVDGTRRVEVSRPQGAILGRGATIDVPAGRHVLTATTCAVGRRNGFYLVRR